MAYDPEVVKKIEDSTKAESQKYEDPQQRKIRIQLQRLIDSQHREDFVCYEDLIKNKKKKVNEEDSSHLNEYFLKIKDKDKKAIKVLIDQWFVNNNPVRKFS